MATYPGIPCVPVALVGRMHDGQLVVLHGQAEVVETGYDEARPNYRTTIEWRHGHEFTQLRMTDIPGVQVRVDGDRFQVAPLLDEMTEGEDG
jgi:hypothetical protein